MRAVVLLLNEGEDGAVDERLTAAVVPFNENEEGVVDKPLTTAVVPESG